MEIKSVAREDPLWQAVITYAQDCGWSAGPKLAQRMREDDFQDWERVFAAVEDGAVAGYCVLTKTDCIPDVLYTPYISFVFVGEPYRGRRLSQEMIRVALEYAKSLGFQEVYLVSDHVNLYEKYGFRAVDKKLAPWGAIETIYVHET